MSELKRIDPVSTGKLVGLFMAIIGFFIGLFFTAMSVIFTAVLPQLLSQFGSAEMANMPVQGFLPYAGLFGAVAIVAFPIMYGIFGFIWGAVGAGIYNLLASRIGGIQIDLS